MLRKFLMVIGMTFFSLTTQAETTPDKAAIEIAVND